MSSSLVFRMAGWLGVEQIRLTDWARPFPSCVTSGKVFVSTGIRRPLCHLVTFLVFRLAEKREAIPTPWPCHSFQEHLQGLPWQRPALWAPGLLAACCLLILVLGDVEPEHLTVKRIGCLSSGFLFQVCPKRTRSLQPMCLLGSLSAQLRGSSWK